VHSNSAGFRGIERSAIKAPGVYRIVAYGGRATFGFGLDDGNTYPAQLERKLNAIVKDGRKFEVWNGGVPGATASGAAARLDSELTVLRPDLVILEVGAHDLDSMTNQRSLETWQEQAWEVVLQLCGTKFLRDLRLCVRALAKARVQNTAAAMDSFRTSLQSVVHKIVSQGIPVFLVKAGSRGVEFSAIADLQSPESRILALDLEAGFPVRASDAEVATFWQESASWLYGLLRSQATVGASPDIIYRLDPENYNAMGQGKIADFLIPYIVNLRQENAGTPQSFAPPAPPAP
jgi:lysophospholipase L1-like esterase